jgi:hypothetical protein
MKKERKMKINRTIQIIALLVFIAMVLTGINACGYFGIFGEVSWKEEVLLHDGNTITVKRWQKRGGVHEPGIRPPVGEQSIKFTLPGTQKVIKWRDEYSRDIGRSNFTLLALHILNSTPYIITTPRLCLSYNKWGRPNPPYVIFKFDGKDWKRIELADLPLEFKNINMVINTEGREKSLIGRSILSAQEIKYLNSSLTQDEFKTIIRKPISGVGCPIQIYVGKGTWMGEASFKSQPSYDACVKFCNFRGMSNESCPCKRLFKTGTKANEGDEKGKKNENE